MTVKDPIILKEEEAMAVVVNQQDEHDDEDDGCGMMTMFGGLDFNTLDVAAITSSSDEEEEDEAEEMERSLYSYQSRVDELLQYQDNLPCASATNFEELFAWASNHAGANFDGIVYDRDDHGGRTLFATHTIGRKDEVLAVLPRSLRIGQAFACRYLNLPYDTPELSALALLVLAFCQEGHVYAKCLPRGSSEFTNALLMTHQQQLEWTNDGGDQNEYANAFRAIQSRAKSCKLYIRDYLSSASTNRLDTTTTTTTAQVTVTSNNNSLDWAISMVKSRSHAFGSKRGFWLTPILDLVNHSTTPNAKLVGDATGNLLLKSTRPLMANEEITIDYQVDNDPQLVATYGFSLLLSNSPSN